MSKSRNDRGKTPSVAQNIPPTVQNAIIPGKLMEDDWNDWVENETGEDFIDGIVKELAHHVCNKVYEKVIQSRVRPYAVLRAKELLLDIIVWRFLHTDDGESNTTDVTSWIEDEEPTPCVTDSWAQGAVPVISEKLLTPLVKDPTDDKNIVSDTSSHLHHERHQSPDQLHITTIATDSNVDDDIDVTMVVQNQMQTHMESSFPQTEKIVSSAQSAPAEELSNIERHPSLPPQSPTQSKIREKSIRNPKKFNPYRGSVPKFHPISLTPVTQELPKHLSKDDRSSSILHSTESLLRIQNGRPPGIKQVQYNEKGNVIHVQKISPNDLPNHRILTKYEIVDMNVDSTFKKRKATKGSTKHARKPVSNSEALFRKLDRREEVIPNACTPLPPPMVDTMDVSEGVVIREGGLSKSGPRKFTVEDSKSDNSLLPVTSPSNRILTGKEIVADGPPLTLHFFKTSIS